MKLSLFDDKFTHGTKVYKISEQRKALGVTYESRVVPKRLFFFNFYSVDAPKVVMPHRVFNKIGDATISIFWVILNQQLDGLKHLRRQLDGSV